MGYRSKFEASIAADLKRRNIKAEYEPEKLPYVIEATYLPDWRMTRSDGSIIYIEAKGKLTSEDRRKMLAVKQAHPALDIRFIFQAPNNPIRKGSRTTYSMWASANGFPWANKFLPADWT